MKSLSKIGMAAAVILLAIACNNQIGKSRPPVSQDAAYENYVSQPAPARHLSVEQKNVSKFTPPKIVPDQEVTLEKAPADGGKGKMEEDKRAEFNREEYANIIENRFLRVRQEPLSTFSIDVDAASYSNVRRYIQQGALPPAGAVRIEEMINYFDYRYPQPTGTDPFSVNTELSACPWNPQHRLVLIGLQGKEHEAAELPAANLVFLIDVSGSMDEPNKLPLVKTSLKLLTEQLREKDHVAIVVYAGNAGLVLPSTSGSEKRKIKEAIDNLEAGGSTAGGQGLELAYKVARQNLVKGGNNRIVLATDGDFNVGASSEDELVRMIEKERETGVFLSVLGFGMGNYQDNKMQQLADKGNGNHSYIDNINEARKVLVKEFGSTLFTIAKDVKIQVEFNPEKVQAYRLIGYENRALAAEDFNDDKKDAGELGSGHRVTALYEIIPAGIKDEFTTGVDSLKYQTRGSVAAGSASDEWMTVKLRYKEPDGNQSRLLAKTVNGTESSLEGSSANFRFAAAVAEFGLLLRNSDFKEKSSWQQVLSLARGAKEADNDGYRSEFIGLVETASALTIAKR
ncbi:MAG: VWA domain-containing protein [Bacteroidetes bacterium]|nr:VWA domain-containing protein [Bacteroidota bacterium]